MANGYKVTVKSIASDGTNYFVTIGITSGANTFPDICPVFAVGTAGSQILTYIQTIATAAPTLASDIVAIVGASVTG